MNEDILQAMKRRNVTELLHFTSSQNLYEMLRMQGTGPAIVPGDKVNKETTYINDALRFDGTDHINLSIQRINRPLFYCFKEREKSDALKNKQYQRKWLIISIHPDVLKNGKCQFTPTNAATRNVRPRSGVEGFNALFADDTQNSPFNQQAECLFFASIPFLFWQKIYVADDENRKWLINVMKMNNVNYSQEKIVVQPELFQ